MIEEGVIQWTMQMLTFDPTWERVRVVRWQDKMRWDEMRWLTDLIDIGWLTIDLDTARCTRQTFSKRWGQTRKRCESNRNESVRVESSDGGSIDRWQVADDSESIGWPPNRPHLFCANILVISFMRMYVDSLPVCLSPRSSPSISIYFTHLRSRNMTHPDPPNYMETGHRLIVDWYFGVLHFR